ncbi:MAG: relaxase domain-containing protein [Planctomycetes bacterium]|nr:relaxase domain-containing protein [Planctomycetota bacterium]
MRRVLPVSWDRRCLILRIVPIASAGQAEAYYAKTDGGYYLDESGLRTEWVGLGAAMLGLSGTPEYDEFRRLIHGLHPQSGEQLTAKLLPNRLAGWDVNVHCPKGVTVVIEQGDERVREALWEATRETIGDLERYATTRVRKGGEMADRRTGNVVGYAVEHAETRPAKEDKMPDPHRHIHVVLMNVTYDRTEKEWKAVKMRPIMDLRKYFDRRFNLRLSHKLAELGYGIEGKWQRDGRGGRKYMGWDITGVPQSVVSKFSRRSAEIEKLAGKWGITDAVAKDQLGAKSRLAKRDDVTLDDYRRYWESRMTPGETKQVEDTIDDARLGRQPSPEPQAEAAMTYAIAHAFERESVVPLTTIEVAAMERSMGTALPEDIERQVKEQGLLIRDGKATTKDVLDEERKVIGFARGGRGACRSLAPGMGEPESRDVKLSAEQKQAIRHIWESKNKVMMVRGIAGVGKTTAMRLAADGIEQHGRKVLALAQSSDASRRVLRDNGFADAETIAMFLENKSMQKNLAGGVLFVDEGSLVDMHTLAQVFAVAKEQELRIAIWGDKRQHGSVSRGSVLTTLEQQAGLPVPEISGIRRQSGQYREAVAALAKGEVTQGFDMLNGLGWIHETGPFDRNGRLVNDYLETIRTEKRTGEKMTAIIIAPTHREGEAITADVRARMKATGQLGPDERVFQSLSPLHWTAAERSDAGRYAGSEVAQFSRNSGKFKAGQKVPAAEALSANGKAKPQHFSVYAQSEIQLASGDAIRITAGGKTKDGKHKLDNGAMYTVQGFTAAGDIRLNNGWVLDKSFGHIAHGYTMTSFAAQGRTVDRVLIAMGRESLPAINAQQVYVSVSRGRTQARIYTNMSYIVLRDAIRKTETRMSAVELMGRTRLHYFGMRARDLARRVPQAFRQLADKAREVTTPEREMSYGR